MDKVFYEVFESLPRQGPGDDRSTKKAYMKLALPEKPDILDIGCGSGKQTLTLAGLSKGCITAVDIHKPFLESFRRKYEKDKYPAQVRIEEGDMSSLKYADASFDLIWSEGSCFILGFQKAIASWRRLLRPNGYIVISDLVWFRKRQPKEVRDYFARICEVKYYKDLYAQIDSEGYDLVQYFKLPHDSWWTSYCVPMEKEVKRLEHKYSADAKERETLNALKEEIDMHRRYHDYFGYGFYLMRKRD
jgi:ubiquinone/menaquinone biosynthesis C-methylase UbiE